MVKLAMRALRRKEGRKEGKKEKKKRRKREGCTGGAVPSQLRKMGQKFYLECWFLIVSTSGHGSIMSQVGVST